MQIAKILESPTYDELKAVEVGLWVQVIDGKLSYYNICGTNCMICIGDEPTNDLRGSWHSIIEVFSVTEDFNLGSSFGGSRYYFDFYNAVSEIEAWLIANHQLSPSPAIQPKP